MNMLMLVEGGHVPENASPDAYSGYVRYFEEAVRCLRHNNVEVTFGTVRDRSPLQPVMERMGCETFELGCESALEYPKGAIGLAKLVRQRGIELLHLHEPISGTVGGTAARLSHKPSVFHRHHTTIDWPAKALSFTASRATKHVIAVSHHAAKSAVADDRVAQRRVTVVHNGIAEPRRVTGEEATSLRRSLTIPSSAVVLLTLGHLRPEKGFDLMLRALPRIMSSTATEVHCVVLGTGPAEGSLQDLARSVGLTTTHFCGHQADVWPWLRMADIVVVPSHKESFGLVAVEAMAMETAVVAARTEGLVEVIKENETGLFFDPGDHESLARELASLINDAPRRKGLAAGGRCRYLAAFTSEVMVRGWINVYRALL